MNPIFLILMGYQDFCVVFDVGLSPENESFERNSLQFDDPIVKNLVDGEFFFWGFLAQFKNFFIVFVFVCV
jgi:hypothetical protein